MDYKQAKTLFSAFLASGKANQKKNA